MGRDRGPLLDHGARDRAGCDPLQDGELGSGSVEAPTLPRPAGRRCAGRGPRRPTRTSRAAGRSAGLLPDRDAGQGAEAGLP